MRILYINISDIDKNNTHINRQSSGLGNNIYMINNNFCSLLAAIYHNYMVSH